MTKDCEQVLTLLQEVALLKEAEQSGTRAEAAAGRKRRKEIGEEIKQLAREKKKRP